MNLNNSSQDVVVWPEKLDSEEKIVEQLKKTPILYGSYRRLNREWRQRFLDFCQGKKSLPLTYDPFFKRIFHPDIHPDRLSRLVSSLLGMEVKVVRILPNEDSLMDGDTLLIMDLLGELEDGSLINVEIQKQSYAFPAERISCYSSDLIMRQYTRVRGVKGNTFTYRDIKKVYVIVIFEQSMKIFHESGGHYVHHGKTVFDTGLKLELLQECFLIALDVFREIPYPKIRSEQSAWLSLLSTESLEDAEILVREYPWLEEIYEEIAMLRQQPEEVLGMFSEALRILDENTAKFMIEELQKKVEERDAEISKRDTVIEEKDILLNEQNLTIDKINAENEALKRQLKELSEHR